MPENQHVSKTPTPYAVYCHGVDPEVGAVSCGLVYLTHYNYKGQMMAADYEWRCPQCGASATWDEDNYESPHVSRYRYGVTT